jgi:hypothetical protein
VAQDSLVSVLDGSAVPRSTWDDFVALDEDDLRDLIDGELVEVEAPTGKHEEIVASLCFFYGSGSKAGTAGVSSRPATSSASPSAEARCRNVNWL